MSRTIRTALAALLAITMPLPALAQPNVIAELGTAPLIGQIASTSDLQADIRRDQTLFRTAGVKLGLSAREYALFESRIASRQLSYVTIPRHLDAMSWSSGGNVYVLHDVVIPANTNGWEIDLTEGDRQVALFVPARCGNLSIVRRTLPHVAQVPRRVLPVAVKAAEAVPVAPTAAPAQPAVVVAAPAPVTTPPPYESVATTTPAHHAKLWPLLLIPLIGFLSGGHSSSGPVTSSPATSNGPGPGGGLPPPGCPTPAPTPPH